MADDERKQTILLTAAELGRTSEYRIVHPLNDESVRYTKPLGDLTGLKKMGVHLVRVEPGSQSSELHNHEIDEEFVYILEGRGVSVIDDQETEVGPGDFLGYTTSGPAHMIKNPFDEDLVFLVAGTRSEMDANTYPRIGIRQFRVKSINQREYVKQDDITHVTIAAQKVEPKDA